MFEYKVEKIWFNINGLREFEKELDKFGEKGWELISQNFYDTFILCTFKKPII